MKPERDRNRTRVYVSASHAVCFVFCLVVPLPPPRCETAPYCDGRCLFRPAATRGVYVIVVKAASAVVNLPVRLRGIDKVRSLRLPFGLTHSFPSITLWLVAELTSDGPTFSFNLYSGPAERVDIRQGSVGLQNLNPLLRTAHFQEDLL